MNTARPSLPPLQSLLYFESAARHLNFTSAAQELGTTQPAVSLRVRSMEDQLGVRLFRRLHRGVRLTDEGLKLYEAVCESLDTLRVATTGMQGRRATQTLTLATDFGFAKLWLLPRMRALRSALPDLQLRVLTSQQPLELAQDEVDLAIVFGPPPTQGDVWSLFPERVSRVCSPALAQSGLEAEPLLHLHQPGPTRWATWDDWFAARGGEASASPGLSFNDYSLVIHSAVEGHGVALGWSPLVDDLLACGDLVALDGEPLETERGYFLCSSGRAGLDGAGQRLRDWILGQRERRPGPAH